LEWWIKEGDQQFRALDIFKAVHQFWASFLDRYGIE
jgi:hypothetical protein